ncbi:MAG: hypothetical protein NVSMB2_24000 [Chloroflexota bacterium]
MVAFGLTRLQPVAAPARPTPAAATITTAPTVVGTPADPATQRAIQDVVRRLDDAQTQAIATGNQQVMQPTATASFYQEQVTTNQDLVASGVSDVKLLNLEWGDITVSGDTAVASVYETWQTTFIDGTTQQGRDLNVYTLVKDPQGSGWIVQSDDHPDQPPVQPAPTRTGP